MEPVTTSNLKPFDAVVLMSFGGPERPEDVLPFLQNVTRGRGIPDERLNEVGEHYYSFGGRSPINDQNRALRSALEEAFAARGIDAPVLWGNRNWDPFLADVLREQAEEGARTFLAIDTSAYSSYSSCRQYREDFAGVTAQLAEEGIEVEIDKIRQYYNHPGFAQAELDAVRAALTDFRGQAGEIDPAKHRLLYVTHSIPNAMQSAAEVRTAGYQGQHQQLIDWIAGQLGDELTLDSELVYCSRSGPPHVPWLEPDVNDRMEELKADGVEGVILVPIGFVSDHMEVKFDLDTEAKETADELGMAFTRAATVGTHEAFVSGLVDLVEERAAQRRGEDVESPAVTPEGPLVPGSGACSIECCRGTRDKPVLPQWESAAG
ncbi:ferrochelatase [Brevibacterium luteolum]|uniref:ferrochelatase n=1 Tax=Brevibacterium luteolum TaxID=199591 RepID=UPI00267B6814